MSSGIWSIPYRGALGDLRPLAATVVVFAALGSSWLVAENSWALLSIPLAILLLFLAVRLQPIHWLVLWLVIAGFLGAAPGVRVGATISELTPERLVIALPLLFSVLRLGPGGWLGRVGAMGLWLVLFSAAYLLTAVVDAPGFGNVLVTFWHHYVSAFVVFVLAVSGLDSNARRRTILRLAVGVGGLLAVSALMELEAGWEFGWTRTGWGTRVSGTLDSPPVLGAALASLLFLALHEVAHGSLRWRVAGVVACGLMLAAIFLTYTRGAWLSILAGVGVLALLMFRRRPALALTLLAAGLLALAVVPRLIEIIDDPRLQADTNAIGRLDTSLLSWQQFTQRPLFGWGPLTNTLFGATSGYADWVSHNTFLSLLVATGLVGATLYAVPIGIALSRGLGGGGDSKDTIRLFAAAAAIAYVVNASAVDMQYFSYPHGLFWLSLGLILTRDRLMNVPSKG